MLVLDPLTLEQVKNILNCKVAKYLSQNKINRHYIIKYNSDNTFINDTFESNIHIGSSHGTYTLVENENKEVFIYITYNKVYESPHITSPFNKDHYFYPKLFEGYTIGPLYTKPSLNNNMISIIYPHPNSQLGIKILNFY